MDSEKIFGERICALRTENNMTQQQLGEAVGLTKQAINDIEKGRRQTTIIKAILLARLFNTTVEYLMGDSEDATRPNELSSLEYLFSREDEFRFSKRLKELRTAKNLSFQEMGKVTYLGTLAYKNLEYAEKSPSLSTLIALADYFNVSLDYLVGRSDDPTRY